MGKKEDFMEEWRNSIKKLIPDLSDDDIERTGSQMWMGRDINYAVVDDDNFDLLVHRYFHGVANIRLSIMMLVALGSPPAILVAEQMFALGMICGIAHERGWDVDTVASVEEAAECLEGRPPMLPTRAELDQADALPITVAVPEGLPEDFGEMPPPFMPPDVDLNEGEGYH